MVEHLCDGILLSNKKGQTLATRTIQRSIIGNALKCKEPDTKELTLHNPIDIQLANRQNESMVIEASGTSAGVWYWYRLGRDAREPFLRGSLQCSLV